MVAVITEENAFDFEKSINAVLSEIKSSGGIPVVTDFKISVLPDGDLLYTAFIEY